jgi:hypothetical protein
VTKAAPFKTSFRHWLEGDLLVLGKPTVWLDVLMDLLQGSSATRQWVNRKAFPAIATSITAIALWRWNGALVLALLMASSSSFVLYRVLQQQKQFPWRSLRQWLKGPQAPLVLSLASGVALLVVSYSALGLAQNLHSPWLALMLFTQEMGILLVLGLAVWSLLMQHSGGCALSFDRCVAGLLHRDALRRLMAVRQLAELSTQNELSSGERSQASEYLQLLAHSERDPLVHRGIQESLAILAPPQRPQLSAQSANAALTLQSPTMASVRQKVTAELT